MEAPGPKVREAIKLCAVGLRNTQLTVRYRRGMLMDGRVELVEMDFQSMFRSNRFVVGCRYDAVGQTT